MDCKRYNFKLRHINQLLREKYPNQNIYVHLIAQHIKTQCGKHLFWCIVYSFRDDTEIGRYTAVQWYRPPSKAPRFWVLDK